MEHRQVTVDILHLPRLFSHGDPAVDLRHSGWKNRRLKLRHLFLARHLHALLQVRFGIIPFSLAGRGRA
jgi:hypothetical protein